jgi:hypothetical protein
MTESVAARVAALPKMPTQAKFELGAGRTSTNSLLERGNSSGYRMAAVNSQRERRASERDFKPTGWPKVHSCLGKKRRDFWASAPCSPSRQRVP